MSIYKQLAGSSPARPQLQTQGRNGQSVQPVYIIGEDEGRATFVAEVLKALGHPLRLRLVAILAAGPQHVNALAERLGTSQSVISQQLRILRMRSLVKARREDGFAYYDLAEPRLLELLRCMDSCAPQ